MKLVRVLLAAFIIAAPVAALAQAVPPTAGPAPSTAQVDPLPGHVTIIQTAPAQPAQSAPASFSVGDLGGQLLNWLAVVFGAPIAGFVVLWLKALAKKAGIEVSQAASDKLNSIIENGINIGAARAGADLAGKLPVDVQNKILADAVNYAKEHGKASIGDLAARDSSLSFLKSVDPNDPKTQEALAARATAALNKLSPETVIKPEAVPPVAPAVQVAAVVAPLAAKEPPGRE